MKSSPRKKEERSLKKFQILATKLDGLEIEMKAKTKANGKLREKISAKKICEKLKEYGFSIKKNQILLDKKIQEAGEFPIKIKLPHNLESEIRLIILED